MTSKKWFDLRNKIIMSRSDKEQPLIFPGADAHWIGGPKKDQTDGNKMGGYAFFETSQLPNSAEAANTVI